MERVSFLCCAIFNSVVLFKILIVSVFVKQNGKIKKRPTVTIRNDISIGIGVGPWIPFSTHSTVDKAVEASYGKASADLRLKLVYKWIQFNSYTFNAYN